VKPRDIVEASKLCKHNQSGAVSLAGDPGYCTLAICVIISDADVIKMGGGNGMVYKIFLHTSDF
jgi:hypothetical protein